MTTNFILTTILLVYTRKIITTSITTINIKPTRLMPISLMRRLHDPKAAPDRQEFSRIGKWGLGFRVRIIGIITLWRHIVVRLFLETTTRCLEGAAGLTKRPDPKEIRGSCRRGICHRDVWHMGGCQNYGPFLDLFFFFLKLYGT